MIVPLLSVRTMPDLKGSFHLDGYKGDCLYFSFFQSSIIYKGNTMDLLLRRQTGQSHFGTICNNVPVADGPKEAD